MGKKTGGFQHLQWGAAGGRGMGIGRHQEAPMCAGKFHYLDYITIKAIVLLQDFFILEKSR